MGVTRWQVACIDMAGTTVHDEGLVDQAFTVAVAGQGVVPGAAEYERMRAVVRKTQGQSKIDVFRLLFGGDERRADAANETFEEAYGLLVDEGAVTPIPGAAEAIEALRAAGVKVALMTGFARATQEAIVDAVGWRGLVDLTLSPAEAGRGRPYPDLVLVAALRLGVEDMRRVAVVGDTPLDVIAGCRAGAGLVAGVLTGGCDRSTLLAAGATHVIGSVGELPELLEVEQRQPSLHLA
ncbi:phosphonatase-like hydrolase [Planosporangium mesophilum]|uniref:Putative haloacid dehalogenase-like hydrolase n=1 Tax=Planosporangium mesophilum TaxID=689768 RepID=A0A8J3T901_9ACTN|nr:phosphonatase-like hydrolase [Planosporangium mesophilum]GII20756.1 putative haloacid dehalogenase-like hydrolase [Planosporangium mesophilum]